MGFADLAAQIVFVFIFMVVFVSLFTAYRNYVANASEDLEVMYANINDRVQTDFEIGTYSYVGGVLSFNVSNTGATTLDYELVDVFVDGERIPRSDVTRGLSNQIIDFQNWNPTEDLDISFTKALSGEILVQVSSEHGISAYKRMTVS